VKFFYKFLSGDVVDAIERFFKNGDANDVGE
jgi:hypothetical protein